MIWEIIIITILLIDLIKAFDLGLETDVIVERSKKYWRLFYTKNTGKYEINQEKINKEENDKIEYVSSLLEPIIKRHLILKIRVKNKKKKS